MLRLVSQHLPGSTASASTFLYCLLTLIRRHRSHFRWEAVRRWSSSLGLQHREGVNSSSRYAIARNHALRLTLILCLVLRLRGGVYPQYILTKAAELNDDDETIETKFYPLYDKILNYWFPANEGYDVCPQWSIPQSRKTVDFTVTFVIELNQRPLLLVEIKPPWDFQLDSGREAAIVQIIQRLDEIGPNNQHVDRLYAISAIGKGGGHVTP
jgi:hypothetical protein